MLRYVALMAFTITCLVASPAAATKVNGKIIVAKELREALADKESKERDPRYSGYWNEPNGVRQVEPPAIDPSTDLAVVVFKDGAPAPKADEVTSVKVHTGAMEKNVVVIRPGTRVKFLSVDPYDHSLYSPELETFGPEKQSRKAFRPIDFTAEGAYSIRCKLLTHFKGWVVVTPANYVLEVAKNGTFTVENMEPGKYKIKVFHDGAWIHEQDFEIPEEKTREVQVEVKLEAPAGSKAPEKKAPEKEDEKKDEDKVE